jgi:hypothetical protein
LALVVEARVLKIYLLAVRIMMYFQQLEPYAVTFAAGIVVGALTVGLACFSQEVWKGGAAVGRGVGGRRALVRAAVSFGLVFIHKQTMQPVYV